ncbi:hypothetical protein ACFQZC_00200 [Streptacidiphilus monticola]
MSATRLDEDSAWQLADLLSRSRTAPVAVVIPTSTHESHFPEAHRLDCDLTTPQPAPVAGQEVLLQRITQTEYEMLHADLHLSERDALPAEDEWHHVPQTTAPLDDKPPHTPRPDHTEVDTAEADPAEADSGPEGDGDRSPRPVLLSVFSAFQTAANPATVTLPNPEPAPTTQGLDSASRDEDGTPHHSTPNRRPANQKERPPRRPSKRDTTGSRPRSRRSTHRNSNSSARCRSKAARVWAAAPAAGAWPNSRPTSCSTPTTAATPPRRR